MKKLTKEDVRKAIKALQNQSRPDTYDEAKRRIDEIMYRVTNIKDREMLGAFKKLSDK